jgi:hypothetical protein
LILMIFILSSCAHHRTPPVANPKAPNVSTSSKQYRKVPLFNQIQATGRINLNLHTGYKIPQLILTGDPIDLAQVQTMVRNNTLYINLGTGFPQHGEVTVDVRGRFLNKFRYTGAGIITGNQLNTRYLDLYLANAGTTRLGGVIGLNKLLVNGEGLVQISGITSYNLQVQLIGSPKVQLSGNVNLAELDINGNGWLSLYWVKSTNLLIKAKKAARIQLAGIVNRLEVELWGSAQFKGRYLRAQRSFVKTHDNSVAEISSINHQSNLATDASDIYYYNIPNTRADFMGFDGSVLDMRDLSSPYLNQEYTRYNKQFP